MQPDDLVIVALSGGVDSAVSAMLLRDAGYRVQCLHMSNWKDDGYCEAAKDFQDARRVCNHLDLPLHRVDFSDQYRERVFADFLDELRRGHTPNPDVLCNQGDQVRDVVRIRPTAGRTVARDRTLCAS